MSTQIAVRLSGELVAFLDEVVSSGAERSRAAVVTRALERERRRLAAERDAAILARAGEDPDLAGLTRVVAAPAGGTATLPDDAAGLPDEA